MWNTYITELEESRNINFPFQYCQFMGLMLINAQSLVLDARELENVCEMTASTVPYLIHPIHITGMSPVTVVY